ncbi:MAG: sulfite exporter TauE/SafE family protein [Microcoleaceae cyanobacterium]
MVIELTDLLILGGAGLAAGILAGFLGIGGGTIVVPILLALGYQPVEAVATSSLSITITALSGSLQNWRMGYLKLRPVLSLGLPALITAQIGAYFADTIFSPRILLFAFAGLLLLNTYLIQFKKKVTTQSSNSETATDLAMNPVFAYLITGGLAGLLAGLFGVGGGVIMVPLQILLLNQPIKTAIQTSLGVIIITGLSACLGHAFRGNVIWITGILLGVGGLIGSQFSTRYLPKLSEKTVSFTFRLLLIILAIYVFKQAWQS